MKKQNILFFMSKNYFLTKSVFMANLVVVTGFKPVTTQFHFFIFPPQPEAIATPNMIPRIVLI